jgi:hypothetical protein
LLLGEARSGPKLFGLNAPFKPVLVMHEVGVRALRSPLFLTSSQAKFFELIGHMHISSTSMYVSIWIGRARAASSKAGANKVMNYLLY